MADFIEILSPSALADLEKLNKGLLDTIKSVDQIGKGMANITMPSGANNASNDIIAKYKEQEKAIIELQKQIQKLSEQKRQSNRQTSEEVVNQRALAQSSDRVARANSALVGAYARLNAQYQIAEKRVLDLRASQSASNAEIRKAQREFDVLRAKIMSADQAVGRWNRSGERSIGFMKNLVGAFGIVGGATLFATISRDIFNTTKELQGLNNALMLVTETQSNFAEQQTFLQRISEAYGLELMGLTKQFTQFYVSAKDKISGDAIQNIFESISKSGASMGLSVQQQERAFLALNQMMSKGTIQAEELRGQLGEALPGAFGIMAKAVGVTEKELGKMMKAGELIASDVLPKFAEQLEKTYGIENINRIETMTSATNRLSNAWTNFVGTIGKSDGVISKTFTSILNFLSKSVEGFRQLTMSEAERSAERINNAVAKNIEGYKEYLSTLDLTNKAEIEQERNALKLGITRSQNARREIDLLKEQLKELEGRGSVFERDRNQIRQKIEILEVERQKYLQQVDAFQEVLKEQNKKTEANDKETESITKTNEATRKKAESYKLESKETFSLLQLLRERLKIEKDLLEVTDDATSRNMVEQNIKNLENAIKEIEDPLSQVHESAKKATDELAKLFKKPENAEEMTSFVNDFMQGFIDDFAQNSGFSKTMFLFSEEFKNLEGDATATALAISEAFQEAFNTINEFGQANFENEFRRLEQQKEISLMFAGESASAREEIENQYEQRRAEIQRRQAESQKRMAMFNILTNTAQAILATYAKLGFPKGLPSAIAMGAIGALQLGLVASQPIPQFYKGTDYAPEGWAWTQEKGAEMITDKNGNIKSFGSGKGAELTYLSKGDKVYTASETLSFQRELNGILNANGIDNAPIVMNNIDLSPLNERMDNLASIIKSKESITLVRDRKGERIYKNKQRQRIEFVNNRINIKGYDI